LPLSAANVLAVVALLLALALGIVSGLRTFTSLAALGVVRGGWGYLVVLPALGEYVVDALPVAPARTRPSGLIVRLISGAVAGYVIAGWHGASAPVGAGCGVVGALIGTYGGYALRMALIARLGAIPAALAEDVVAIALAAVIVTR
jgi:uncharacterized membrane protein